MVKFALALTVDSVFGATYLLTGSSQPAATYCPTHSESTSIRSAGAVPAASEATVLSWTWSNGRICRLTLIPVRWVNFWNSALPMSPHGGIRKFSVVPDRLLLMVPGAGQFDAPVAAEPPEELEHAATTDATVTAAAAAAASRRPRVDCVTR